MPAKKTKTVKTKSWAIGLMLICTLLASGGQVLLKIGSKTASFDISLLTNYTLIVAFLIYGVAGTILIFALKGGELSVLYPIIATSFIWVSFLSSYFLGEAMNLWKLAGIIAIIIGVSFIGAGSKK